MHQINYYCLLGMYNLDVTNILTLHITTEKKIVYTANNRNFHSWASAKIQILLQVMVFS